MGDLARHARIFPINSLRFFSSMQVNGVRMRLMGMGDSIKYKVES